MNFSNHAMSAILLCSYVAVEEGDGAKPLSLGEWNTLIEKLAGLELGPGALLEQEAETLGKLELPDTQKERLQKLLARGGRVALGLDELSGKGIDVVTVADAGYPKLLRQRLKKKAPQELFYAGNLELANKIGIAVAGSRNVDQNGIEFTKRLAEKASEERLMIYSGGARGVDIISESTALETGGGVVSYLADSLASKIKKKDILNAVIQGRLLLISDVKPDAGFSTARAMNRNKYIYASSYAAFVVASDYNKGGTWAGATEAMRNEWTRVMVWDHKEYDGNQKLIAAGGTAYELSEEKLWDIIQKKEQEYIQMDLFHMQKP